MLKNKKWVNRFKLNHQIPQHTVIGLSEPETEQGKGPRTLKQMLWLSCGTKSQALCNNRLKHSLEKKGIYYGA